MAVVVAAMAPAGAQAGTLTIERGSDRSGDWTRLRYTAAPRETNAVRITYNATLDRVVVADTGATILRAPVDPASKCIQTAPKKVACKATTGYVDPIVTLADGNDSAEIVQDSAGGYWSQWWRASVNGGPGADRISSTAWSNQFTGGLGADDMTPGWFASYRYDDHTSAVSVSLDGGANDGAPGEGDNARPAHSGGAGVTATAFADVIVGSPGRDEIDTGDGENVVHGLGGDDSIVAGRGADEVHGGDGADFVAGGDGADLLFGDAGDDYIDSFFGGAVTGAGFDAVHCGDGTDYVYSDADDALDADCETRAH
jgi:Ca2+-binding RTX toxin-like protein